MKIEKKVENDVTVLKIEGQIISSTSQMLEDEINAVLQTEDQLMLDFERVEFMASSGIRVLLAASAKLKEKDGLLILTNVNSSIRRVLDMTGLLDFLDIRQ